MQITEKDLEDLMFQDIEQGGYHLRERGLTSFLLSNEQPNKVYWYRQVQLKSYGIADIIGFTRRYGIIYVDIFELKNVPLCTNDFDQISRYHTAVKEIINNTFGKSVPSFVQSILIGPDIDSGHYIHNQSRIELYTFTFSLAGFHFQHNPRSWVKVSDKGVTIRDTGYSKEFVELPKREESNG
jgi:hypothetical protein